MVAGDIQNSLRILKWLIKASVTAGTPMSHPTAYMELVDLAIRMDRHLESTIRSGAGIVVSKEEPTPFELDQEPVEMKEIPDQKPCQCVMCQHVRNLGGIKGKAGME